MKGRGTLHNQQGLASLMVTTVLVLVIVLIITGFALVARRNQREVLDRQLSTQAIYAAESGINATVAKVRDAMVSGIPPSQTTCDQSTPAYPNIKPDPGQVEVTCTLVQTDVKDLKYTGIIENSPTVVPLTTANSVSLSTITLKWHKSGGGATAANCTTYPNLPTKGNTTWTCGHGILRVDLTNSLGGPAMSSFFYPRRQPSAPSIPFSPGGGGLFSAACVDSPSGSECTATISGLSGNTHYMSVRSIYEDSDLTLAATATNGTEVKFTGQVSIDVTARAQDVLKRLQVRVPLEPKSSDLPAYPLESSGSICKRFSVEPGYYREDIGQPCS